MAINQIVQIRNLTKKFGSITVLDGINLEVHPNQCLGILGPNASGKTTLIRMISGISSKTSGEINVFGMDIDSSARTIKAKLGIVPQEENLDINLTVEENLLMYARYFGLSKVTARERANKWLKFFHLYDRRLEKIESLSTGFKKRLLIARAMIGDPQLLILDEPSDNLDFWCQELVWNKLKQLREEGVTQIVATHNIEEAERLCNNLIILDSGKIRKQGDPLGLIANEVPPEVIEISLKDIKCNTILDRVGKEVHCYKLQRGKLFMYTYDGLKIIDVLRQMGIGKIDMIFRKSNLRDVFMQFSDKELK